MTPDEVKRFWDVDPRRGLPLGEVTRRRRHFGRNVLPSNGGPPIWAILLRQWNDFMVLVLLGATAVAFFLGETTDAVVILCIVIANGVLGFFQEYRAEAALASLAEMTAQSARVLRDGRRRSIDVRDLVPGDIILFEPGDRIPADVRLLGGEGRVDEAVLTGESVPVYKSDSVLPDDAHLSHRSNMLYRGTALISGRIWGAAVATGQNTELGEIASMLRDAERLERPPLQKMLERLGHILLVACVFISGVIAIMGILRGKPIYDMFLTGVSLAVAAIPEGLPAVVTVALAVSVQRMAEERAVLRNLKSVETLGCATVICTDKTGTLTRNRLRLEVVSVAGWDWEVQSEPPPAWSGPHLRALRAAVRCSDIEWADSGRKEFTGDPTEVALAEALESVATRSPAATGPGHNFERWGEISFSSSRRRMSVWGRTGESEGRILFLMKGAPETVIDRCSVTLDPLRGTETPMTDDQRREALKTVEGLTEKGYRVLAVAERRDLPPGQLRHALDEEDEKNFILLGFVALLDPPRPECYDALRLCEGAGIRTVMITGDHPLTAYAVARRLQMIHPGEEVVTGEMLECADSRTARHLAREHRVFARVTPRQKLHLVRHLKDDGHVVVMTGDGVNDAPALGEAHIGVAMGETGTDVTREAADLVLLDDNFATIVAAVREGRGVFRNIRKFINYLLSCNIGEVLVMLIATAIGLPHPLLPHQILLVNLVTDGLPAVALGMEPAADDLMKRPPRDADQGVFTGGLSGNITVRGVVIGFLTIVCFALAWLTVQDLDYARTVAVFTLVVSQLVHAVEIHGMDSGAKPMWVSNRWLVAALVSSLAILISVVYIPALADSMAMVPLGAWTVLACSMAAAMSSPMHAVLERIVTGWLGVRTQSW